MSGFEIAGIVLGGFPILVKCLRAYQEAFEPLEEWWNFRTQFVAFIDDVRHQMMRYNENMIRLLDPIIADGNDLDNLVQDLKLLDPRWHNGTLDEPLKQRLGSESDRFFRILGRMKDVMDDLGRLLQIENGKASWVDALQQKPWQWHLRRLRISFSMGKHKKIHKLAACNQELQDILGYSERIIPIADRRKSSEPVGLFEKIRQHACGVYNAFKRQWRCDRGCRPADHEAHLSLGAAPVSVRLDVVFVLSSDPGDHRPSWHRIQIAPSEPAPAASADIRNAQESSLLAGVQKTLIQQNAAARKHNLLSSLPLRFPSMSSSLKASSGTKGTQSAPGSNKAVQFHASVSACAPVISGNAPETATQPELIADLCLFLAHDEPVSGVLEGDMDRCFQLQKLVKDPEAEVQLVPLPELMKAHHQAWIDITRQSRFEMATHIASVLLQAHTSPWLPEQWAKTDFYFLVDTESGSLRSTSPLFSRSFHLSPSPIPGSQGQSDSLENDNSNNNNNNKQPPDEEHTRACLFTVGVMILELIFGHNLEDCQFRQEYYGSDNKPNDQTDVCTARRWAKSVLGESGANVADVVRRCLDCSFGPRPNFGDVRFRESVYEGVVKPLADYSKAWPEVMP